MLLLSSAIAYSQSTPAALPDAPSRAVAAEARERQRDPGESRNRIVELPRQVLRDQIGLWESPLRLDWSSATWLVPVGGLAAAMVATDSDVSRSISAKPHYGDYSNYGIAAAGGVVGGTYLLGLATHDEHARETGVLSGESALNSIVIAEVLSRAIGRERPNVDNSNGKFWHGGTSFPSEHAAIAWAVAGVFAHEYPNPFLKLLVYGAATGVSAARVEAKEHFPSDALVGSALGWLVGEYVFSQHHNVALGGRDWSLPAVHRDRPGHWAARNMASPYVPLDSWIYGAFDRLIALGYIHTAFQDMRPWTRMECARLVVEAQEQVDDDDRSASEAGHLYHALHKEFSRDEDLLGGGDNSAIRLESAYSRSSEIAGEPLTDGYHFAQTSINDYGRPYERGFNDVSGLSAWAADGPFAAYLRVEYQHSPAGEVLPLAARQAIAQQDFGPDVPLGVNPSLFVPPGSATGIVNQPELLDSYVAMNAADWQLSYGKQSLWWGPSRGGPMLFSNNADPINMFRVNRVTPFRLPSFLGFLGPMRIELFVGQLSGYEFILNPSGVVGQWGQTLRPQPIIHGERFSFQPTENLEIGFSRTTDYGGPGYPLTLHSFFRSVFSTSVGGAGTPGKPGDRRSGIDATYRIPGARNGLTLYCDGFVEDEPTPLVKPDVAAWSAGLYLPRIPGISKLDLRVEGVYTDLPGGTKAPGYFYYDSTWISGYRNSGNILGSWIGRGSQGAQAWSDYWLTARNKLELSYRHQKVSSEFDPGGGTLTDLGLRADLWMRSILSVSTSVQYETWAFPLISATGKRDITSMVQFSFWPSTDVWRKPASE